MDWERLKNEKLKRNLVVRAKITRAIREFFWSDGFCEIETPTIVRLPGQEPYLHPVSVCVNDAFGAQHKGYLITSPEYCLKKVLAAGFDKIFQITPCYRNREEFGGLHNPEFTMLEWYRASADYFALMDDIDNCLKYISEHVEDIKIESCERISMRDLWKRELGANLDELLTVVAMQKFVLSRGYNAREEEQYEDLFFRVFLNEIEGKLGFLKPIIVYDYPAQMASLSRLKADDARYAERFELYIKGKEIANAFSELTDGVEQKKRLNHERNLREKAGFDVYDVDDDFIEAVFNMKNSAGIALGIDRLVMVLLNCEKIEDVLVFPASEIWKTRE